MGNSKTISFIGSGNVATHLANAFFNSNISIKQVYSKSFKNANSLAKKVNAQPIDLLSRLSPNADLYIIAVPDDLVEKIIDQVPFRDKLIVHTSGSVPLNLFRRSGFQQYGIFYPLQTFSKKIPVDLTTVPICVEANSINNLALLINLAEVISEKVYEVNSEQRKSLHLSAVFACNFSNYMYQIANDLCNQNHVNFDILKPLIIETANKIINQSPLEVQTGPAKRNDITTIKKQLQLLENHKNYQDIYQLITENIQKTK